MVINTTNTPELNKYLIYLREGQYVEFNYMYVTI